MKNHIKVLIKPSVVIFTVMYMISVMIMGECTLKAYANDEISKQYVTDDAGILKSDEIEKLEKLCASASRDCKTDIFIVTLTLGLTESKLKT